MPRCGSKGQRAERQIERWAERHGVDVARRLAAAGDLADAVAKEVTPENAADTYAKSSRVWERFCAAAELRRSLPLISCGDLSLPHLTDRQQSAIGQPRRAGSTGRFLLGGEGREEAAIDEPVQAYRGAEGGDELAVDGSFLSVPLHLHVGIRSESNE
ncbi:hypothetical protein [Streptomyces syringium]|uniref:hypothetical protein n=1 Tax=Streptomyces syringium TaxID=76729 RepID=UPI003AAFBEEE